jgi:hypothetical protein
MDADEAVAHFAFEFGLGDEGGDGVDDEDVDGIGADEGGGDFERLFGVIGLGDEEIVDIDAEFAGIGGIEGVFHVDEGGHAAGLLGLGDGLEGEGGFTGGFRAVDFDDAAAREAAHAQGMVEGDGTRRDDRYRLNRFLRTEPEHGTFAKLLLNGSKRGLEGSHFLFFVQH